MSWWNISEDDVLGDVPADLVDNLLKEVASISRNSTGEYPTLEEILSAVGWVLYSYPDYFVSDSKHPIQKLTIKLHNRLGEITSSETIELEEEITMLFNQAFEAIAREYEEQWQRKPRLREVLRTITFVLSATPTKFVSDGEGIEIDEITAQ